MMTTPLLPPWSRPIRIPESVPLTHADPPFAIAGDRATWRLPFVVGRDIAPREQLKIQLWGGRNNRGGFLGAQADRPTDEGFVTARIEGGPALSLCREGQDGVFTVAIPPGGIRKGATLTLVLGDTGHKESPGIRTGSSSYLNKFFVLYALPPAGEEAQHPSWSGGNVWSAANWNTMIAACTLHVLGTRLHRLRAYAPAAVSPGKPFRLVVRPEDEFGNRSSESPVDLAVFMDGAPVPARIEPVAQSTCLHVTVSLPAPGVRRLTVRDLRSGLAAVTNPILCAADAAPVFWGMIHGHTEMSDGTGKLDEYFRQLREDVGLDFAATADHDHLWETSDDFWAETVKAVKRWHVPGQFVTLLGYEWAKWRKNGDGDRNVYYLQDDRPLYRSDDGHCPTPPDLFAALTKAGEKAVVIPHHPGHGGNFCDWKDHSQAYERLVEIFQVRGSYECAKEDGNPVPEKGNTPPFATGYVKNALQLGWRVGFTAGGDDHDGHSGTERSGGRHYYKQGLMSVEATDKTREAIFGALANRRVVATTGPRMLLTWRLNGQPMGSELHTDSDGTLKTARKLEIEFHGTAPVDRIDINRNGQVIHSAPGQDAMDMTLSWEDQEPLDTVCLPPATFCDHPFAFYYIRVVQTDGEVAWASPIWIDP